MSHTLHRSGSRKSLERDFPLLAIGARGFNREGCSEKMYRLAGILTKYKTANCGIVGYSVRLTEKNLESAKQYFTDTTLVHAVFTDRKDLENCLRELKEADIGLSVTVSGLFDVVRECCSEADIVPHTVNMSLGVWGNTAEKMPKDNRISEISSMCGHGMVPFALVEDAVKKVKSGRMSPEAAAEYLTPSCTCHVFNTERAAEILSEFS